MKDTLFSDISVSKYVEYLSMVNVISWDWNLKTNHKVYSERYTELVGYIPEELSCTSNVWERFVLPEDIPDVMERVRKHASGETAFYESKFRLIHKDGHIVWCSDKGKIIEYGEDSSPLRMIGVMQKISDLKNISFEISHSDNVESKLNIKNAVTDKAIHKNKMLRKVNEIAEILLSYDKSQSFKEILHRSLELIGKMTKQKSVYMWKDVYENNELSCEKIYEWMEGIESVADFSEFEAIPYSRLPSIKEALDSGNCFNDCVENMLLSERNILESRGIKALLVAPVNLGDKRWGFIEVDNCKSKKAFTRLEENMLLMSGFLLALTIQKIIDHAEIKEVEERLQIVLNATPLCCCFFDNKYKVLLCNDECVRMFSLKNQREFIHRFYELSPLYQPNGRLSEEIAFENMAKAFTAGECKFEWMHKNLKGELIPSEIILVRVKYKDDYMIAGYIWDLRKMKAMMSEIHKVEEELCAARDEALASSRTKSEFLAKMSHEIRTPMNAIVGMSELILREQISPAAKDYTATIKQASGNLLSIINDILDLSKIESGKLELTAEEYMLSSLINDVINIISMKLIDKPVLFTVNVDSNLPNNLIGDEIRIKQILINLLSNAVKYTEEGHISLTISGEYTDIQTVNMTISVSDTGVGIKEKDMENLFGDYAKFDIPKNKGVEGTGLGLAISKKLCKAMNGDITAESVYGEGSSFTVVIPQSFCDYYEIAQVKKPEQHYVLLYEPREVYAKSIISSLLDLCVKYCWVKSQSELYEAFTKDKYSFMFFPSFLLYGAQSTINNLAEKQNINLPKLVAISDYGDAMSEPDILAVNTPIYSIVIANILNETDTLSNIDGPRVHIRFVAPKAKILIVDDISTNLKVAKGLMSPYNMQIDVCESGIEAIDLIEINNYDIVFMDHMMPIMDGIDVTKIIRENSDFKDLVIIALTANAVVGVKEMFFENGFNDFLSKPIEMIRLNEILEKWIPDDKKEEFSSKSNNDQKTNAIIEIDGIDVKVGLSKTGGGVENYIEILNIFLKDGAKKLVEIKNSLKSNDIKFYTTCIHALKSALASIGATELSDIAKALELAGKSGDINLIERFNDKFIDGLEIMLRSINQSINIECNISQNVNLHIDSIKPELLILKKSLQELDGISMNQIIRQLKNTCKNSNFENEIEALEQYILMCEYEKAIEYIDNLICIDMGI